MLRLLISKLYKNINRRGAEDAEVNQVLSFHLSRHSRDKIAWSNFERAKCGPQGERQDACSNAVI